MIIATAWTRFHSYLVAVGCCLLALMGIGTLVNITLRYLGGGLVGISELSDMALAIMIMLTLAHTQLAKKHITVDVLTRKFSPTWQHVSIIAGCLFGMLFFYFAMVEGAKEAWRAYAQSQLVQGVSYLHTWPAKTSVPLGCGFLCIQLLSDVVKETRALIIGLRKEEPLRPWNQA